MGFMAWFIKFHELCELLKVHRVTCPYSYSWVHEKIDFIFMSLWQCQFSYSWVHVFLRNEIHELIELKNTKFMRS